MPRRGIDGVAEQEQLHDGDEDHGRKRQPIAPQLHEFLDEHGQRARQGTGTPPSGKVDHWKLSCERAIRSMNTSSSDGGDGTQVSCRSLLNGAMAPSSASASRPATCKLVPNGATMSMPLRPASWSDSADKFAPLTV